MKRNKIVLAATSGLLAMSVLAGSMAAASSHSDAKAAQELTQFLGANPQVANAVADVEAKTGGKVAGAEFDDESAAKDVVEFEVTMADGSEQSVLYRLADGTITKAVDHESDGDGDHGNGNDADGDSDS